MASGASKLISWLGEINLGDVALVGGKNASLGEMFQRLTPLGVRVPDGFAVTAAAYDHFIHESGLQTKLAELLRGLDTHNFPDLQARGRAVRESILSAEMPSDLAEAVRVAYRELGQKYGGDNEVAVRSSATAEDLPGASFAGQQETYLNVRGEEAVVVAVKKCFASLFTDRAISYRQDKGFAHLDVSLSVTVQRMVRSDLAASGVMFTIDTESGFPKVVVINAAYGLGELIVQGGVTPDEFVIFKPTLATGARAIIAKDLGLKDKKIIYDRDQIKLVPVSTEEQNRFSITDDEVLELARWGVLIEEYFSKHYGRFQPMDIEWAKDGQSGQLFVVQARPETVHSTADQNVYREYRLEGGGGERLAIGAAVGAKIATGRARLIRSPQHLREFEKGEVLITEITDPDWEPIMKIASAIVTDRGGRTSHAAIVSRELGIPCVVGTGDATSKIPTGETVTVDCSSGRDGVIYRGALPFRILDHRLDVLPTTKTKLMLNVGSPEEAFRHYRLPAAGVGLGRLEFIINSHIRVHPNLLINFEKVKTVPEHQTLAHEVETLTRGYADKRQYYVEELAEGVAKIAAAVYPREAIIRFSDFKTNEYRTLLGGALYEPEEENPMLGWRGTSRYYHPNFRAAFALECQALKRAREVFGLRNIVPMVPFCRTLGEADRVLAAMVEDGLDRSRDQSLKIYMMCEIPSNIILAEEFLNRFDGYSIGSNDLTQLVLGLDRDSALLAPIGNETDEALRRVLLQVIEVTRRRGKYIGICGQAPSDFPDFAAMLVRAGIDSLSLNPDSFLKTVEVVAAAERATGV